ncbi:MAG: hypothetical protein JXR37_22020 [Kiritimatiellae bacterium]|nr:hypothetical protein [Kiritimatiellia bacterium]
MRRIVAYGLVLTIAMLAGKPRLVAAADAPPRWIEPPKPGEDFQLAEILKAYGYTQRPATPDAPPGSVQIWGRGGEVAHSSVVVCPGQQIEMGHKPGGSKFVSELLPPKKNPKPNKGEYELLETWQPPEGAVIDLGLLSEMVGMDREYDSEKKRWNCHGFSANVVRKCVRSKEEIQRIPDDKWVIWYAEKIGWQPVYVTTQARYKKDERSSSYPGGGIDPHVILEKAFVGGPYDSLEEATKAACDRMSNFRRLKGIYAGLPVADMLGRVHNIRNVRVPKEYWEE